MAYSTVILPLSITVFQRSVSPLRNVSNSAPVLATTSKPISLNDVLASGELAAALREGTPEELALEFADVLAWLATIANVAGVDLDAAVRKKYGSGCPGCGQFLCCCDISEKP